MGLKIIFKYFKYKDRNLLYLGVTLLLMTKIWLAMVITYISILATGNGISPEIYFIIGYAFPIGMFLWLLLFTNLMSTTAKKKIIILLTFTIYLIISEIIFFSLLFTNPSSLGIFSRPLIPKWGLFMIIRNLVPLALTLLTGILFWHETWKSTDPEIRLKGKLLPLSIIFFIMGSLTFAIWGIPFIPLIFLIPGLITLYGSFLLPKWMKRLFLKEIN